VYDQEEIDCDNDRVETFVHCSTCHSDVRPKLIDGKPCWHGLTEEEMEREMWRDIEDDDDVF